MGSILVRTAVKESFSFLGMSVQIDNHFDLFFLMSVLYLILDEVDLRVQLFAGVLPSPVEVSSDEWAAVVAVNDAIGVDHGEDLEDEGGS